MDQPYRSRRTITVMPCQIRNRNDYRDYGKLYRVETFCRIRKTSIFWLYKFRYPWGDVYDLFTEKIMTRTPRIKGSILFKTIGNKFYPNAVNHQNFWSESCKHVILQTRKENRKVYFCTLMDLRLSDLNQSIKNMKVGLCFVEISWKLC